MTHHSVMPLIGIIGIVLAVWLVLKVPGMIKALLKQVFKDTIAVLVWRHFSGAHYHGNRVTNAGWWEHGSSTKRHDYDRGTFMDRWEHKPRGHRMLWRWGCTVAFFGLGYGVIFYRTVTLHAAMSLIVYAVVVAGFVIEKKVRLRVHNRHLVNPIVKSLAPVLRLSPHAVRRMLCLLPENISDEGENGYLELPPEITPSAEMQTTVARIIDAHMPVDTEMDWRFQQAPKLGVILAAQKPPDSVPWASMLAEMARCAPGEVVLGADRAKQPYKASLTDLEDPHWGFDVNTKFGKSNFLGIVTAQILHQDPEALAIILDPKRSSLIDFVGSPDTPGRPLLPGVTLANNPADPEAMWAAVQKARKILDDRAELAARERGRRFPCVLVIVDELNQFGDIMKDYWNDLKAADKRLPKDQRQGLDGLWPGWADIMAILRMGRFVNMHVLACAQDFRDDAFGGRGGRNYLGFKGMAGFNPSQWDKFMQTKPVPVMQNHPGRWIFSDGHDESWVQVVFADAERDRAAYDYAAEGRTAARYADWKDTSVNDAEDAALATDEETLGLAYYLSSLPSQPVSPPADDGDGRLVITGEQAAADYFEWKLTRFQTARRRTAIPGEFRHGKTPCWHEDDLLAWEAARPRSKSRLRAVADESVSD